MRGLQREKMKRFFFFLIVSFITVFSAEALMAPSINLKITKFDKDVNPSTSTAPEVTYTFSSGNDGACYVNKASGTGNASTFWFCGKKPTSAKCGSVNSSKQDTVFEWA